MLSGPLSSHETQRSEVEAFVRRLTVLARRHVSEAGRVADPATPHALHDSALSTMLVNPVTACSAVGGCQSEYDCFLEFELLFLYCRAQALNCVCLCGEPGEGGGTSIVVLKDSGGQHVYTIQ